VSVAFDTEPWAVFQCPRLRDCHVSILVSYLYAGSGLSIDYLYFRSTMSPLIQTNLLTLGGIPRRLHGAVVTSAKSIWEKIVSIPPGLSATSLSLRLSFYTVKSILKIPRTKSDLAYPFLQVFDAFTTFSVSDPKPCVISRPFA